MLRVFDRIFWPLLALVLALNAFGLIFIASSAHEEVFSNFVIKQLFWIGASLVAMVIISQLHYRHILKSAYFVYGGMIMALVYVYLFARVINGAKSWIRFGPIGIQPSELMKLATVLALAHYLRYRRNYRQVTHFIIPFGFAVVPTVMILRQPDLGSASVFLPVLLLVLFAIGARLRHIFVVLLAGLLLSVPLWHMGLKDYQKNRIRAFMEPDRYESTYAYQLIQSKIAIGSGGITGKGWQQGTQHRLNYLPEPHSDFIFAVIAEEWGLLGASALLAIFMVMILMIIWCAAVARDPFLRISCLGVAMLFFVQVSLNVAVTLGLMPTTGVTLPFVSYGGSSMLASYCGIGLVMNALCSREPVFVKAGFDPGEE